MPPVQRELDSPRRGTRAVAQRMRRWCVVLVAAAGLVAAACGGAAPRSERSSARDEASSDAEAIDFGEPGDPSAAARTVRVRALDSLEFRPSSIGVNKGDTITFVITNVGSNRHEFTLGDEDLQLAHERQMSAGGEHHDAATAVELEPGATEQVTWLFTKPGEVLYGCHIPGHYEGGMVGSIKVS